MIMLGSTGGIMATTVFRAKDFPKYIPGSSTSFLFIYPGVLLIPLTPGLGAAIGSQGVLISLVCLTTWHFSRLNKAVREGTRKEPLEGQPGFYYTL